MFFQQTGQFKVTIYTAEQRRLAEIEAARIRKAQEEESKRLMEQAVEAESAGNTAIATDAGRREGCISEIPKAIPGRDADSVGVVSVIDYSDVLSRSYGNVFWVLPAQ